MNRGRHAAIVCLGAIVTLLLAGCESSQSTSARLRSQASASAPERGLTITRPNPDVRVTATTVLTDAGSKRSAAVITVRNTSRRELAALPLVFSLTGADGKRLFTNASPGASTDLVSVPSLPPGGTLSWVHNAITDVSGATGVDASVGVGSAGAAKAPALRISKVRLDSDPIDGTTAVGKVFNDSTVAQERLVVFGVARRGGRVVAAGRAIVPTVKPGAKGASFTIFFVGDPRGATLSIAAPPVTFGARG
jgi:hypothetical protein